MNLGNAIRLCRRQKSLSQTELADAASISVSYLSLLERNQRDPNFSTLTAISNALKVPLGILIFLSADKNELESIEPDLAEKLSFATYKLMKET